MKMHAITIPPSVQNEQQALDITYAEGRTIRLVFIPFKRGGTVDIVRVDDDVKSKTNDGRKLPFFPWLAFCTDANPKGEVIMGGCDQRGKATLLSLPYDDNRKETKA